MPNVVATDFLQNGPRKVVVNITLRGDGSGDEVRTPVLIADGHADFSVERVEASLAGFTASLEHDAATPSPIAELDGDGLTSFDWTEAGGVRNPRGTGYTGDVVLSTTGLGSGDLGTITIWAHKKG